MTEALARPQLLDLESFSTSVGLHPEHVRRLVALGLLEPQRDIQERLWFPLGQVATAQRMQRLRAGLCLNYAALGLVVDLLDRITYLETQLERQRRPGGAM